MNKLLEQAKVNRLSKVKEDKASKGAESFKSLEEAITYITDTLKLKDKELKSATTDLKKASITNVDGLLVIVDEQGILESKKSKSTANEGRKDNKTVGFAIDINNISEFEDGLDYQKMSYDIAQIELNVVKLLSKRYKGHARDEGHDNMDDLVGSLINPSKNIDEIVDVIDTKEILSTTSGSLPFNDRDLYSKTSGEFDFDISVDFYNPEGFSEFGLESSDSKNKKGKEIVNENILDNVKSVEDIRANFNESSVISVKEAEDKKDDKKKGSISDIIAEVIKTNWSADNDKQFKNLTLMKGIATSDEASSNKFMKALDDFTSGLNPDDYK